MIRSYLCADAAISNVYSTIHPISDSFYETSQSGEHSNDALDEVSTHRGDLLNVIHLNFASYCRGQFKVVDKAMWKTANRPLTC